MFLGELLLVLFLSLVLTLVFAVGFRRQSWGGGLIVFFLILFLATWAGGIWLPPSARYGGAFAGCRTSLRELSSPCCWRQRYGETGSVRAKAAELI